jgi:hypothetical protein
MVNFCNNFGNSHPVLEIIRASWKSWVNISVNLGIIVTATKIMPGEVDKKKFALILLALTWVEC